MQNGETEDPGDRHELAKTKTHYLALDGSNPIEIKDPEVVVRRYQSLSMSQHSIGRRMHDSSVRHDERIEDNQGNS